MVLYEIVIEYYKGDLKMNKRYLGFIISILVLTLAGCSAHAASTPFRGNTQYTGVFSSSISRINKIVWKFPIEYIDSAPVIDDGTAYFGTSSLTEQRRSFYAVNTDNGVKRWQFDIPESVKSSPVVQNNTVFFTGYNYDTQSGHLYALDTKNGDKKWSFKTGIEGTGPVYANGIVYFGAKGVDSSTFNINAIDSAGKLMWKFECIGSTSQTPIYVDDTIYIGVNNEKSVLLYAIDAKTGNKKWESRLDDKKVQTELIFSDNFLYIGLIDSRDSNNTGYVYSLQSKTGESRLVFEQKGFLNNLALNKNTLFLSIHTNNKESTDGFYALDLQTGKFKWKFKPEDSGIAGASISNGIIYLADNKNLYAIDSQTGEENWRFTINHVWSDPVISNGNIYVSLESSLVALH